MLPNHAGWLYLAAGLLVTLLFWVVALWRGRAAPALTISASLLLVVWPVHLVIIPWLLLTKRR